MKHHILALAAALALAATLSAQTGVPRRMALDRKAMLDSVAYRLIFRLPADPGAPAGGNVEITFSLDRRADVPLDFKAVPGALSRLTVDGREAEPTVSDEHVWLRGLEPGRHAVRAEFAPSGRPLNRRDGMAYTLLVPDRARTLFPCFDQPDIKATYTLDLILPERWEAVANSPAVASEPLPGGAKRVSFAPTEPLSTYLFSFAAGEFRKRDYARGGRRFACYYRETDSAKVAQIDTICAQVAAALEWQERYTGIPYPFAKYDFVILPGFQFGGMEHTGATLYNDNRMFLPPHPTPDQELERAQLIAHETSHMWFGDLVTMRWFDDVWTKEVFANYFAAMIVPQPDRRLGLLRDYQVAALAQDRTDGRTAIRQRLDNLSDAGLVYNPIIYCKAPVVMDKMAELMGPEAFREGIRAYLRGHAYADASWDDLIAALDTLTPVDLAAFSREWVNTPGLPRIDLRPCAGGVSVRQNGRWPQTFQIRADSVYATVSLADTAAMVPLGFTPELIVPNTDGRAYGLLAVPPQSLEWAAEHWHELTPDVARMATLMNLNENCLDGALAPGAFLASLLRGLPGERNPLIAASTVGYMAAPLDVASDAGAEAVLLALARDPALAAPTRTSLFRLLYAHSSSPATAEALYDVWRDQSEPLLSDADYTNMAYELALRYPERHGQILAVQRARIADPDRLRQFDFVSRAVTPDSARARALFAELLTPQGRAVEPWAVAALRYLAHPARGVQAAALIAPALAALPEVQHTGDIFMPANWCAALLSRQATPEAAAQVRASLSALGLPPMLESKVLQSMHPLITEH